jgi:hypothetical protein
MAPGTFAELTPMLGWDDGDIFTPLDIAGCTTGDYITQYAEKAAWDPVNQRVLFVGQAHGQCYGGRFVSYTDATNTWKEEPWVPGICKSGTASNPCFSHAYDHNTADPTTGDFYYRNYGGLDFFKFANGSWSTLPPPPAQSSQCCGALEFFPDMNRLVFIDGDWGVWAFDPGTSTWEQLANTSAADATPGLPNLPMSSINNWAIYNPSRKVLLLGGGTHVHSMDASGNVTTLGAPPVSIGVTQTVISVDPVSGVFILLADSGMFQYEVTTDTWTPLATAIPDTLSALTGIGDGLIQAPITTYGVILYAKYNFSSSKVYLYRHAEPPPCENDDDCASAGACQAATCDTASGACKLNPVADGTACSGGTCMGGVCSSGSDAGTGGAGTGGSPSGGSGPGSGGGAGQSSSASEASDDGGCGCKTGVRASTSFTHALLLLCALAFVRTVRTACTKRAQSS